MSYDFNTLPQACDHRVLQERYVVDTSDFKTLRYVYNQNAFMKGPVNGLSRVSLYLGGSLVQPSDVNFGYQLIRDMGDTLTDPNELFYKIQFKRAVRLVNPLIEVNYTTRQMYCNKCNGSGQTNDLSPANSGSLIHITGNQKLTLKSLKWILSSTCAFYPTYTCAIKRYIGKKFGLAVSESDIALAIMTALETMKQVQNSQSSVQTLDQTEILKQIINVSAVADPTNPTLVNVSVTIEPNLGNIGPPINFTLRSS